MEGGSLRIVITGGAGFVGAALTRRLVADGHHVVTLDTHAGGNAAGHGTRMVVGDLADSAARAEALRDGCDALVHLATVPGGAAEADPAASRRINVDAMYDLLEEAKPASGRPPRVVYASSIAVFGDPLPPGGVDDATPLAPRLVYAGHKAMMEVAVMTMSLRGEIDGVTVRLPGILARPEGPSGLKSAFMSELFHAALGREPFTCPVSADATIWAQSVACVTDNLRHAILVDSAAMPRNRTVTLPALRIRMADLIDEVAAQTGSSATLVSYRPDAALEAAFGTHPALVTTAAAAAGFVDDGDVATLVSRALGEIAKAP